MKAARRSALEYTSRTLQSHMNRIHRRLAGIALAAGILAGCLLLKNEQQEREACLAAQVQSPAGLQVPAALPGPPDETGYSAMRIVCPGGALTPDTLKAAASLTAGFGLLVYLATLLARAGRRLYNSATNALRRAARSRAKKTGRENQET